MICQTAGRVRKGVARTGVAALFAVLLLMAGCAKDQRQGPVIGENAETSNMGQKGTTGPVGVRRAFTRTGRAVKTGRAQINGFLWRAALDTVSFMPISSVDSFGGVIITDWYTPPETPGERLKVTILVRGDALRSDGVKVTVFRQIKKDDGWVGAVVEKNTQIDFENVILSQARVLRNQARNAPAK